MAFVLYADVEDGAIPQNSHGQINPGSLYWGESSPSLVDNAQYSHGIRGPGLLLQGRHLEAESLGCPSFRNVNDPAPASEDRSGATLARKWREIERQLAKGTKLTKCFAAFTVRETSTHADERLEVLNRYDVTDGSGVTRSYTASALAADFTIYRTYSAFEVSFQHEGRYGNVLYRDGHVQGDTAGSMYGDALNGNRELPNLPNLPYSRDWTDVDALGE
jgi:prepilin-type processing-associated H-X9-DG protein